MDLRLIVNNFQEEKPSVPKSPPKWTLPKLGAQHTQDIPCHHPTPAASPTTECGNKMPSSPLEPAYPPQMVQHSPIECPTTPHIHEDLQEQAAAAGRIPVISAIEVKGVVIDQKTRKFVCQVCKKEFMRKSGLVRHNLIHLGIRPNQCQVCGKRFLQKSALTVHHRIHSGEKPYACKHCGRRFGDSSSLCRHYRMHMAKGEGGKPSSTQLVGMN